VPWSIFKFEHFELDTRRYELRRNGQRVALQRLPMDLLILLVEQRGALVTREEIALQIWNGDSMADTQSSINTAVRKIRRALGDDGEKHRYVETVAGKGYRFVCEASIQEESPEDGPSADVRTVPAKLRKLPVTMFALALIAAIVATSAFLVIPALREARQVEIVPFTAFRGVESWPAFSPDGNQVAFGWTGETGANSHIYLKSVDSGILLQLTAGPESDSSPSWSRNGRMIAFLRSFPEKDARERVALYVVEAPGGNTRRIVGLTGPTSYRPAWTPDGKGLVVMDSQLPDAPASLFRVALDSGEKRRITSAEAMGTGDWCPAFAPSGRYLAYLHNRGSRRVSPLYLLPVDSSGLAAGIPKKIETGAAEFTDFDWSKDGRSLISAMPGGLVRVPVFGGDAESLPFPDGSQPAVAAQGNRLIYLRPYRDTDIFRVPGPGRQGAASKLISSTRRESAPQYSADGGEIVFVSDRSGSEELWVTDQEGQRASKLTSLGGQGVGSPRWSPDGRWIVFDATAGDHPGIYVIGAGGGAVRRITSNRMSAVRPSWSRNGKWIYFGSDESGEWEVWKTAPGGGALAQVTRHGGREAFEDSRGEFVYFTKEAPARGIWRVPSGGGEETKVSDYGVQGHWAVGGAGVYYLKGPDALEFQDFSTMRPIPLATPGLQFAEGAGNLIGPAPDDRWILLTVLMRSESYLTLVRNFR